MSGSLADRVRALGRPAAGVPVVVAVSGGRDSLCLLDVAADVIGARHVLAVHVHHGLRGADADAEALAAVAAARALGVAVRVLRLTVPAEVRGSGASPVPWAREARRLALRGAADAWGGPATPVLVAHTATDQAETVLLRAIASPGTRSLAGIADEDASRGVLRPLLAVGATREETGAWCRDRGLRWSDDPTNPTTPRGRVRTLLQGLEAVDGRAVSALCRTAELAREDDEALATAARELAGEDGAVDLGRLRRAPTAVGRRVLRRLAEHATGAPCPRVGARLDEVLALRPPPGRPAALDLGDGARAVVGPGLLRCERSPVRP